MSEATENPDATLSGIIKLLVKENAPLRSARGQYFREAAMSIAENYSVPQETLDWVVAQYLTEFKNQIPTKDLIDGAVFFAKLGCSPEIAREVLKVLVNLGGYREYAEDIAGMLGRKLNSGEAYNMALAFIKNSSALQKEEALEMIQWASNYTYGYQTVGLHHELEIRHSKWSQSTGQQFSQ